MAFPGMWRLPGNSRKLIAREKYEKRLVWANSENQRAAA
jgi:hypothetical protein